MAASSVRDSLFAVELQKRLESTFRLVELLDAHARDGPTDHQLLDLLRAFENVEALIRTTPLVTDIAFWSP